ncbi:MAG: LysR family transcriptional regulator [Nannocystaceae bacterium]|nr:LysR family transcriptional regulator [bacterium]
MNVEGLRVFLEVAKLHSFTRAGASLGMTKSRVSRQLQALEVELGVQLFHRTTRAVRLSVDGEALVPRARSIVQDADDVATLFRSGRRLQGRVRIDLPLALARSRILPALPEFLFRHPDLELFISTTDRLVDAVREGFDLVLRVGASPDSQLTQRKLGRLSMVNCVSASYVARRGRPQTPDDLDAHTVVHYVVGGATDPVFEWCDGEGEHARPMTTSVAVNSTDAYREACLAGLGIIQVPRVGVRALLERGELVEVLPEHRCTPMPVSLLHPHGRRMPARVRAVSEWICDMVRRYAEA